MVAQTFNALIYQRTKGSFALLITPSLPPTVPFYQPLSWRSKTNITVFAVLLLFSEKQISFLPGLQDQYRLGFDVFPHEGMETDLKTFP